MDFVILLALCLRTGLLRESNWLRRASRLLMPTGDRRDLLRRLHRETKDDQGKQHSSWLHRLRTWENDGKTFFNSIGDAIASAGQIKELAVRVDPLWIRADTRVREKYVGVRESILNKVKLLEEGLQQLEFEIKTGVTVSIQDVFRTCRKHAADLLTAADELHGALFVPLGVLGMKEGNICKLPELIESLFKRVNVEAKQMALHRASEESNRECIARLDKLELVEAYVVWDAEVQWALQEILTNVRHAGEQPVNDPWATQNSSQTKSHLWVRVWLDKLHAVIELANTTKGKKVPETVANLIGQSPGKYSHEIFQQLGGAVGYSEYSGRVVTSIRLPYAHMLGV